MPDDVLSQLEALAPDLPEAIARLEEQRAQIDAQIKRVKRLYSALTDEPASSRASRASKPSTSGTPMVGDSRMLVIAEAMLEFTEPFTVSDVVERTDIGDTQVHRTTRHLRGLEFIGKAGVRPPGAGGKGHGATLYHVLDAHAIDSLRAKVRSEGNGVVA